MGLNCAIYETATNKIIWFIRDCVRLGLHFSGDVHIRLKNLDDITVKWTTDDTQPVVEIFQLPPDFTRTGKRRVGYDKTADQLTDAGSGPEITKLDKPGISDAILKLNDVADMTYSDLTNYINTNVTDLPSAKTYITKLSLAVLALMKVVKTKF